jgi:hypothetical protein
VPEQIGQMAQYNQYLEAEQAYIATKPQDTFYSAETPVKVRALLEAYRKTGAKVRVFMGDPVTGRDWLEENDVIGKIGRSMGPIKIPLLCAPRSDGGMAMSTECILRLVDVESKFEVYRHPLYKMPEFKIVSGPMEGYPFEVTVNDSVHARFAGEASAQAWVAFMRGERMTTAPSTKRGMKRVW